MELIHQLPNGLKLAVALQLADLFTTLFFLTIGVEEGNPIIRFLFTMFSPLASLLIVKSLGVSLVFVQYLRGGSFFKLNVLYFCLIAWNLLAIVMQMSLSK